MKKLMFAAAALAAGFAMADGITSSNIVGYQKQTIPEYYYNISAASFIPVTGDKANMTLKDIVPNDEIISSYISFINEGAGTSTVDFKGSQVPAKYMYWFEADLEPGKEEGWYLEDDGDCEICQNDAPLPFGDGFMFFKDAGDGDVALTFSGAVDKDPTTKGFDAYYYSIRGNCSPTPIKLGDITPNEEIISSYISFVNEGAGTATVDFKGSQVPAKYMYWFEADLEPGKAQGWYLEDDGDCEICQNELVTLEAGQGFLFFKDAGDGDVTITIPSAL